MAMSRAIGAITGDACGVAPPHSSSPPMPRTRSGPLRKPTAGARPERAGWVVRPYAVRGFHDAHGIPSLPFELVNLAQYPAAWPDGAIWPIEFQEPTVFTRQGYITNWDYEPEFLNGDFFDLKDLHLGQGTIETYQPSHTL